MTQIIGGLISGLISAIVLIILIEKANPMIRKLLIGHYVFTDIMGTFLAYTLLPVVGLATIVNAGIFCIIFTAYLHMKRKTTEYITVGKLLRQGVWGE